MYISDNKFGDILFYEKDIEENLFLKESLQF